MAKWGCCQKVVGLGSVYFLYYFLIYFLHNMLPPLYNMYILLQLVGDVGSESACANIFVGVQP